MTDEPGSEATRTDEPGSNSTLPAAIRRDHMLELVSSREFVRVSELVGRFGVSEVTVRTDLDTLSRDGLVRRVHGGVRPGARSRAERAFEETTTSHSAAKAAIGIAAAGLVEDGDSILLDVGTTTAALAKALVINESLDDLTVFTNGLRIAAELERAVPRITVVVTGGTLRPMQHSLVEPLASLMLARIRPSIVFLGASGVHPQHGITNVNLPEAGLKSTMLATAVRRVLVVDGSKFGRVDVARFAGFDEIDVLVTDSSAPSDVVQALRSDGLEVIVAETPHP